MSLWTDMRRRLCKSPIRPLLTERRQQAARLALLRSTALDIVRACDDALAVLAAEQRAARTTTMTPPILAWLEMDGSAETTPGLRVWCGAELAPQGAVEPDMIPLPGAG